MSRDAPYVLARLGGDEFCVCAKPANGALDAYAQACGGAIIEGVEEPIPVKLSDGSDRNCHVGVSIGYATGVESGPNLDLLLGNADIALYEAKHRGKGILVPFAPSMRSSIEEHFTRGEALRVGIQRYEFKPFYQPQIEFETNRLFGIEVLARWDHPRKGLIGPDEFRDLAQEIRLLDALDGQVTLRAFEDYARLKASGHDLGRLSIHAEELALRSESFCETLLTVAQLNEVLPSDIIVEVPEKTLLLEEADPAICAIRHLSRAGFNIGIDDFGVGFSSMSRIASFNIASIKIDRSLTAQAGTSAIDGVLKSVSTLAQGLRARLIAEGVETEVQRRNLQELGVTVGQGYLWSEPLSADHLGGYCSRHCHKSLA